MLKVLIIEPHGDDSLCSCSSILLNESLNIDILTLGNSRPSTKLKDKFNTIDSTVYKSFPEIDYSLRAKISTHDVHRRYLDGEDVYSYCSSMVDISQVRDQLVKFFNEYDFTDYDYIVYPVGLLHPYHIAVHDVISNTVRFKWKDKKYILYADKPYIGNRYVRECLECFIRTHDLVRVEVNYTGRSEIVKECMKDVYPTEVSMFRFSSKVLLEDSDIYLVDDVNIRKEIFHE